MANELSVRASVDYTKGSVKMSLSGSTSVTVTGDALARIVSQVGTSSQELDLGAVSTPGYILVRNLSATGNLLIGSGTDDPLILVKPGELALFRWATGVQPYVQGSADSMTFEYLLFSD